MQAAETAEREGGSFVPGTTDVQEALAGYKRGGAHTSRYRFVRRLCEGRAVLDIGCGHGLGRMVLGDGPKTYLGRDTDGDAIQWAKSQVQPLYGNDTRFEVGKGSPADSGTYDVVIAFEVVEHVSDPTGFVAGLALQVRPTGTVVLSTPNGVFYDPLHKNPFHVREYGCAELDRIIQHAGLNPTYYKQRRHDGLDVVGRKLLGSRLMDSLGTVTPSSERRAPGVLRQVLTAYRRYSDGAGFWTIRPSSLDGMGIPDYSTIVASCRRRFG